MPVPATAERSTKGDSHGIPRLRPRHRAAPFSRPGVGAPPPLGPDFLEWHYFTAPLSGANGHEYFLFLCSFNFSGETYRNEITKGHPEQLPADLVPIVTSAHLSDYTDAMVRGGDGLSLVDPLAAHNESRNALVVRGGPSEYDIDLAYEGDNLIVRARTDIYECELTCSGAEEVMWMRDSLDKDGFIREGGQSERSFYYSLPRLPFRGWLRYTDDEGDEVRTDVTGQGWVDRQWGEFMTSSWEWTSFRFADGDRLNTYNFGNGYQVCTFLDREGVTTSYPGFRVIQNGYLRTPADSWVSWGWDYEVPVKDGWYRLVPMSDKDIISSDMNTFFEGLSRVLDREGRQVGWAVTESMDTRVMHNGPHDLFNHFPKS